MVPGTPVAPATRLPARISGYRNHNRFPSEGPAMELNENAELESGQVEDLRGSTGGGGGGSLGGGGFPIPIPGGGGGKLGMIITVVVVLLMLFGGGVLGKNL